MKALFHTPLLALACAVIAFSSPCLHGSTIVWTSQFNDVLLDYNGNPLDSTFSFEVGSFGAFTPTLSNIPEWSTNWKVFDRAFGDDSNGWNYDEQFFIGIAEHKFDLTSGSAHTTPGAVFNQSEQVYIWVYNSKDVMGTSQWALVTDPNANDNTYAPWAFPDPAEDESITYEWNLADASQAVIGGANGERGGGLFGATPSSFSIQTAALPIPEPGSALLILGAFALQRFKRKR